MECALNFDKYLPTRERSRKNYRVLARRDPAGEASLQGILGSGRARWLANALENWDPLNSDVLVNGPLGFLTTDFEQCFSRTLVLTAFAVLLLATQGFNRSNRRYLRLRPDSRRWSHLIRGFIITAILIGGTGAGYVLANLYHLQSPLPWKRLPVVAITAILAAIAQELLSRRRLRASDPGLEGIRRAFLGLRFCLLLFPPA